MNTGDTYTRIKLNIPAELSYLPILGTCIKTMLGEVVGLQERDQVIYNVELAAYEACTNIVEHAYRNSSGYIEATVTLTEAPACIVVDLFDTGSSFNLEEIPEPNLDEPQVRGYGLFLVRELMDEVTYQKNAGRNHWRLVKELVIDK